MTRSHRATGLSALLLLAVTACGGGRPLDDTLRLNHVQAKGTHNSYHIEPESPIDDSHRYTHVPLDMQLEEQGVRQFELDLHLREGGELEVFHLPGGLDTETTCRRFTECLRVVKDWSDLHPEHFPIMIWIEAKDDVDWLDMDYAQLDGEYDRIERDVLAVWPEERIITPDDVRGEHPNLRTAIETDGWPTLSGLRGRIIVSLLEKGPHRDMYLAGEPNLIDQTMFVSASSTADDYAAVFKVNDPADVRPYVEAGFLVTTNVDGVSETDAANQARFQTALDQGAHFMSSDLPHPVEGRTYWAEVPDGTPARCNPVTAPSPCSSEDIERLDP